MKKTLLVTVCFLVIWPQLSPGRDRRLANEGKSGLYAKSLDQVFRLREDEVDLATAALIVCEQWSDMVQGRRYLAMLDEMASEIHERLQKKWLRPNYKAIPVINEYLFGDGKVFLNSLPSCPVVKANFADLTRSLKDFFEKPPA
jgi:ATP-dependent exoDNAse (exonuclease V) beta subunit